MKNFIVFLTLSLTFLVASVHAQSAISLGMPGTAGSGCPVGSTSITLSPDGSALTLLFDNYVAQAGSVSGLSLDRKNCTISIPISVPEGYSVSVLTVDYRGFISVPWGGMARFSAEYFFAGSRGPLIQKTFTGPLEQDYTINNKLAIQAMVWSACGADVNLRVNSSMIARTNNRFEDVMAVVDSADFQAGIVFHMKYKRC